MPLPEFDRLAERLPLDRWFRCGLLLAVSGGADSTAMLHFLYSLARRRSAISSDSFRLSVGHINHRLRGKESDDDALFVRKIASRYGLGYFEHVVAEKDWREDETGSREAAARKFRYDFLVETAHRIGVRYVATAHTADDQAETVFHRIVRGTGLAGLGGIRPFRQASEAVTVVRPLLDLRRTDILTYLETLDEPYRIDATNLENEFTRNRIRNTLLPQIRQDLNPNVDGSLCRLAKLAAETENVLDDLVSAALRRIVIAENENEVVFDVERLRRYERATIREIFVRIWRRNSWPLRKADLDHWSRLLEFFLEGDGVRRFYGNVTAEKSEGRFILRRDGAGSVE